jgi:hypothetical protein
MKTALNDLAIVDVQRKPKGLSQDLRASDEFVKDREAQMSLIERGFYPIGQQNEIYSSEGEVTCATKDGVRYVLRFGNLAGGSASKDDKKPGEKDKNNPALNRYLFVMAQLDEAQIPKPQLEPVPGEEKPADAAEAKPADEAPADAKPGDDKPAEKSPEEKAAEEKAPEQKTAAADDAEGQPAAKAKKGTSKTKKAAVETKPESDKAEPAKTEEAKPAAPAADAPKADAPAADAKDSKAPVDEEKKIAIQKENKRKQEEYDAAMKKAQDKVKDLNDRFADWYFIIPDDVYKKIHLGRADIVKKKDAEGAAKTPGHPGGVPGIGDLQELQKSLKGE